MKRKTRGQQLHHHKKREKKIWKSQNKIKITKRYRKLMKSS